MHIGLIMMCDLDVLRIFEPPVLHFLSANLVTIDAMFKQFGPFVSAFEMTNDQQDMTYDGGSPIAGINNLADVPACKSACLTTTACTFIVFNSVAMPTQCVLYGTVFDSSNLRSSVGSFVSEKRATLDCECNFKKRT